MITRTDPLIFRACKATPSSSTTSPTILKRQNRQPSTSSSADTHRGQVWPLSWITDILYERSWGHHQRGATRYYVSSGIGIWGPKIRIGTRSEYLVLRITGNKQCGSFP